jgi:hopene-associated glycosyltransferase HpnB
VSVVAVIPARDEVAVIADAVQSLLRQDYPGPIHVIVVDDGSEDGTAGAAMAAAAACGAAARLSVIAGAQLPPGWSGKVWAMSQGAAAARAFEPEYLLFTDADIHHDPGNIATLVATAQAQRRDLVSYMVQLQVTTLAEKLLIPAFVFFFLLLYPPQWVASLRSRTAAAAGGCMLLRPSMLERIGGLATIGSQLIDDCALAHAVKRAGGSISLGLTRSAHSIRSYGSFRGIGSMISRSAFYQLRHSHLLLLATILGLCLTYLAPVLLLFSGDPTAIALGGAAWMLMILCYAPFVRFYGLSPLWSLCLPLVALFYAAATLHSALQYRLRRGGVWKGRIQDQRG